ncbi:hypothetical protein IT575_14155 [bacterium]|nr:hypothetical protein [bacterium]
MSFLQFDLRNAGALPAAWPAAGLPVDWPADLPLPPESSVAGHSRESSEDSQGLRIGIQCGMSALGLAAYFDVLNASAGFAESSIEVSDEQTSGIARGPLRTLQMRMEPGENGMQGWLQVSTERNLLFNPKRCYLYAYGRLIRDAYPPGFPSAVLCPMPGATLVYASQRGASEASLGLQSMAVTGVVHDFYRRHLSDSGFRLVSTTERPESGGSASIYGRRDEVVRVECYPWQGWLRVECHYSTNGSSTSAYDRGWR